LRFQLIPSFESSFGHLPEVAAQAAGRVNLIGEHTDYNGGFVLPVPIPQKTKCELARRNDDEVWVISDVENGKASYKLGAEKKQNAWWDYVQGITVALREFNIKGFNARFETTVPLGSGLSSSAAFEISLLRALREAFLLSIDELQMAQIGRAAENEFVGARVGIMDQMSAALGKDSYALFIDTLNLHYEYIHLPPRCAIAAFHSGIRHEHRSGDYNLRREECEEACRLLGVAKLRDLTINDLSRVERIPDPFRKRARHVITENERVLKAVQAIKAEDNAEFGRIVYASHESLKNDFEVSIPEIDWLVDQAKKVTSIYGARITGGGFGGSVLFLVNPRDIQALTEIANEYKKETGNTPQIFHEIGG
jgi:galactokinase